MRNWAGNVEFSARRIVRPATVAQLQDLVAGAPLVRALGTGHSFNTVADTTGLLVSTRDLVWPVEVDTDRQVAVVPGGATYAEVARQLHALGWGLHNLGSLPHISVAGACATGTHGSGVANGALATAVVGVELVTADGHLLEVHDDDPRFGGMVLSLGLLGVVTRLWLRVEPTYDVVQDVLLDLPADTVVGHVQEILADGYSVSVFSSFDHPGTVDAVWRKRRVDGAIPQAVPGQPTWGGRAADVAVHPLRGLDASAATSQLGTPGPWHQRLPHFREEFTPSAGDEVQSEYFLPREDAAAALAALGEAAPGFAGALQVFEMRTIAADELWLSPFHDRDTVAVHATWVSDLDAVRPALAVLEGVVSAYDPRPHWAKVRLSPDRPADLYPQVARFRELAAELDPRGCFVNDFTRDCGLR